MKIYVYANCSTCRKALKFLDAHHIFYESVPIRETPPNRNELKQMLQLHGGNVRKLFNTSGLDYKSLKLKDRIAEISVDDAFQLLSRNGNLVKRPFLISNRVGLLGFREEEWKKALLE